MRAAASSADEPHRFGNPGGPPQPDVNKPMGDAGAIDVVAGIDVGNSTTEIVLMDPSGDVRWAGTAPTVGRKGSRASLEGAARLLARGENECGARAHLLALAELRPVDTAVAVLPPPAVRAVVRNLARTGACTPAGAGVAIGAFVSLDALIGAVPDHPVIVGISAEHDFDDAAARLRAALSSGWPVVGVLAAADEAVLIAHRLPIDIPVVDEADLDVAPGTTVSLEVGAPDQPVRVLTDPLAVAAALGVPAADQPALAADLRELADAPAVALVRCQGETQPRARTEPVGNGLELTTDATSGDAPDWVERAGARIAFAAVRDDLAYLPPGTITALEVHALPSTTGGLAVADVWLADLAHMDDDSWLRRGTTELHASIVALLAADHVRDAAGLLAELTERRVVTVSSEHHAAAVGVRSTPAFPDDAVICDIGGGTVDCIGPDSAVMAAGAGEMLTQAVGVALGLPAALAERVKRGPAVRVDTPHLIHHEDGRRTFLATPAPPNTIGRLCIRADSGLVPFTDSLAVEEWRALRLSIKRATTAASVVRALEALPERTRNVVLAGGGALDDELVRALVEALRHTINAPVVARANTAARFGPRFAVAWGLATVLRRQLIEENMWPRD